MHGKNIVEIVVYSCDSPQAVKISNLPLLLSIHSNHRKDGNDILNEQQVLGIGSHRTVKFEWKYNGSQHQDTLSLLSMGLLYMTAVGTIFMKKKSYINHL
jgi:hypothetical protein